MAIIGQPNEQGVITISLTVAEMRKVAEHHAGEPCFRMRLTKAEYEIASRTQPDFTYGALSDGSFAVWRRNSDLLKLKTNGEVSLARFIESRIINDDVA